MEDKFCKYDSIRVAILKPERYIRQEPYISDDGIYIPCEEYVLEGYSSTYKCLITKELFVEAYNKWIKNE